jgi:thymidylate synthase
MAWKTMVTELLWFLRGDTNIKFLVDNGCHIWDGDAFKNYINKTNEYKGDWPDTMDEFIERIKTDDKFAKKWGELGPVYGKQWRRWGSNIIDELSNVYTNEVDYDIQNGKLPYGSSNRKFVIDEIKKLNPSIDQIQNLINDLKTNPDSRRLMVNAWNPSDLPNQVLPPCHYGFQVYTRELRPQERKDLYDKSNYTKDVFPTDDNGWNKLFDGYKIPKRAISLMYNARSQDVPLGTPFNLASYGLLLTILAKEVNMVPDELISNMGDCHIYLNQIDGVKEQLTREPFELPTLNPFPTYEGSRPSIESYVIGDFTLKNYQSHPTIKMPLSN